MSNTPPEQIAKDFGQRAGQVLSNPDTWEKGVAGGLTMAVTGAPSLRAGTRLGVATVEASTTAESISFHRPYIRNSTRATVENNAVKVGDKFVDSNTGKIIEGEYNLGHKYGHEYYKYEAMAKEQGLTQTQFNDLMNNPNIYQIEDALSNQSHAFEAPQNIFYGGK